MNIDSSNFYTQGLNKPGTKNVKENYTETNESDSIKDGKKPSNAARDVVEITYKAPDYNFNRYIESHPATKGRFDQHDRMIEENLKDFYRGKITIDDMKQIFREDFSFRKQLEAERSQVSGTPMMSDEEILRRSAFDFIREGTVMANYVNYEEGAKLADEYGGSKNHDWVYYNADYYYLSEDIKKEIFSYVDEIIKENNLDSSNVVLDDIPKWISDFNINWNHSSAGSFHGSQDFRIVNTSIRPPEGFKLFYKDKRCSFDDMMNGTVYAICGRDPFAGPNDDTDADVVWYFTVPRGKSLLKENSLIKYSSIINGKRTAGDYNALIVDLDKYLYRDGYTKDSLVHRMNDFVRQNFNNYNDGIMIIGDKSFEKRIDVPHLLQGRTFDMSGYNYINYGMLDPKDTVNYNEYNSFLQNFHVKLVL